jgi:hypothetical protein
LRSGEPDSLGEVKGLVVVSVLVADGLLKKSSAKISVINEDLDSTDGVAGETGIGERFAEAVIGLGADAAVMD